MLFNSYLFLFIFMPIVLIGWYILNHFRHPRLAEAFLAGMSLWFYGYFNPYYLAIIVGSILFNYLFSYLFGFTRKKWQKRCFLVVGIVCNLGLLFYFKYYDFFIENINFVFRTSLPFKNILLPLGISFFTFQQLSFLIDRCLDRAEHYDFLDYVTFVTFFPQLVAGPIVLYKEVIPQFQDPEKRRFQAKNFAEGIQLFVLGLAKKVLLADVLGLVVNYGFAQVYSLDSLSALVVILCYTFELYFDFSGYSDMALGIGRMFNIQLPVNFNSPYRSHSVKELWQRWHITLSRFFINYVYIPLGGSRKKLWRTCINILIVFFLSGLWHGAAWTFVVWGLLNGLLVVWDNLGIVGVSGQPEKKPAKCHVPAWLGWLLTFLFFNFTMIFFRSDNMSIAFRFIKDLFSFRYTGKIFSVAANLDIAEFYVIRQGLELFAPGLVQYAYVGLLIVYLAVAFAIALKRKNAYAIATDGRLTSRRCWGIVLLFLWCVISLSQVSTFLYFNF